MFLIGFLLGLGFGMLGLVYFVVQPVLLEYLRQTAERKLQDLDSESKNKRGE